MEIRNDHPLRQLFEHMVRHRFYDSAQVRDADVASYVAALLVDFVDVNSLFKIRNAKGRRLESVAEMLVESNPLLEGKSFDREREVRRHIGDYVLFLSGLFPEYVASLPRHDLRLDAFIDYVKVGKESYRIVSFFDQFEYRREAPLFRRLSEGFESCIFGLNQVKQDLAEMQNPNYLQFRDLLT